MSLSTAPEDSLYRAPQVETVERMFFLGALMVFCLSAALQFFSASGSEPESAPPILDLGSVLFTLSVCILNFRTWKILVGVFLKSGSGTPSPEERRVAVRNCSAAIFLKGLVLLLLILYLRQADPLQIRSFIITLAAFLLLGALLAASVHILGLKRAAAKH